MTAYAPPLEKLRLEDLQLSSDTDSQYQDLSRVVNQREDLGYQEALVYFVEFNNSLKLKVEKTIQGYWVSTSDEFAIYGDGKTFDLAVLNYVEVLREYFQELYADEDILGPFLENELKKLNRYFNK